MQEIRGVRRYDDGDAARKWEGRKAGRQASAMLG